MKQEYNDSIAHAIKYKKENKQLVKQLKKRKNNHLDDQIHDLHEQAFDEIDCLECANCCKTTSPTFYDRDIDRLAKTLRIKPARFIEQYLKIDEDNDYVLKSAPCPFLDHENYCTVYDSRPAACREYPHTNRKRVYQLLDLSLTNTTICPAVSKIFQELAKQK